MAAHIAAAENGGGREGGLHSQLSDSLSSIINRIVSVWLTMKMASESEGTAEKVLKVNL